MIVVHPYDPSTVMLGKVYEGLDNVTLFDSWKQRKQILEAIAAAPLDEPILLLGHGCPYGLYDLRYGLVLNDNAYLTVAVDTIKLVTLKAITIVAAKHMLGSLQVTSRYDKRLWGFTAGYRDANASVAMPPDAHGNSDAGEDGGACGDGPVGTPLFDPALPWQAVNAIVTGKLGTMLLTPPIWELVPDRRYVADSTKANR